MKSGLGSRPTSPDACGRGLFSPRLEAFTSSLQQSWEMQKRQVQGGWLEFPFTLPGDFLCGFPSPHRSWDLMCPGQVHLSDGCARHVGPAAPWSLGHTLPGDFLMPEAELQRQGALVWWFWERGLSTGMIRLPWRWG